MQAHNKRKKGKDKKWDSNKKRKQEEENEKEEIVKRDVEEKEKEEVEEREENFEIEEIEGEEEGKGGKHKNVPDNILLFTYYKDIISESEFEIFKQSLHTKLQTTFRIGGDDVVSETFVERMKNSQGFVELQKGVSVSGENIPPPAPISWYPDHKAWKYSVSGEFIRRSKIFAQVHEFLVSASNSGDIWRQEEASMIPPCFLDAKPNHKILDMCAAPGSKTAQIHDMVFGKRNSKELPTGCVVANDSNIKRCMLLSQRLSKTSSPHLLVTNHDAQHFPLKSGGMRLRFDRILCDVPCSGDGTLRKLPSKAWAGWSTNSAFSLHSLQAAIVQRGLELLGANGRLVYSTCSMNPVENEAVVASILQKLKGNVELVDVSKEVTGLKRMKGLKTWRIMDENGNWYSNYKDVPSSLHSTILPTMFPTKGVDVSRCLRIFPHTQDTSGFFVAVFRIKNIIELDKLPEPPKNTKHVKRQSPPPRFASIWGDGRENANPDLVKGLETVFQIGQSMPWRSCFARKAELSEKRVKHVVLFSESLREILEHNKKDVINVVNGGVQIFERTTKDFATHENFKLTSSSVSYLLPFMGPKRVFTLTNPVDVSLLVSSQRLQYADLKEDSVFNSLRKLSAGYVVVKFNLHILDEKPNIVEKGKGKKEEKGKEVNKGEGMVVCRNGGGSLSLCASSPEVWSLKFLLDCK